ncbi:MAG: RNA polymerase sigma factor [Planctomycetia bacterium]|nr:RNA polymerase sigma factor [Planctomycetia bacterium]
MPNGDLGLVFQQIRKTVNLQTAASAPDGELLQRFVAQQDEAAFEALVRRHGPLVLGVCCRMLSDRNDADDAFQATFCVLVRKAHTITKGESVGSWLYQVAYHAAAKARAAAGRRRARENYHPNLDTAALAAPADDASELRPALDEAVNRLPEKYRRPIVLCYLEGKSNEEAAREIGCPVGTVWTRLNRGRERLRGLLQRRGVVLSAGAVAVALEKAPLSAAVPVALVQATVRGGMLLATGETAVAGAFPASVVGLARSATWAMLLTRLKTAALFLAATAVLVGSTWLAVSSSAPTLPAGVQAVAVAPDLRLNDEARFVQVHQFLKPQPGESRWQAIPWRTSVWQARQQAAVEGKPILLVVAGREHPLGPCDTTARSFRSPNLWSEANFDLIRERFVAVAANGQVLMKRQDAEGEFIRTTCGFEFRPQGQAVVCFTAGGKNLGSDPQRAWQAFLKLPNEERSAGAVVVDDLDPVDTSIAPTQPPAGGLILKIYARPLTRDAHGELRHAAAADFTLGEAQSFDRRTMIEASPDHMWLTADEWKSLVPTTSWQGERYLVQSAITHRLVRHHLVPSRICSSGAPWSARSIRAAELTLTVAEVHPDRLQLRLEGHAQLGATHDPTRPVEEHELGYEAQVHGFLTYDRARQGFTRFDVTALGDVYGKLEGLNGLLGARPGRQPLGFAFELATSDKPADRTVPTGRERKDYFQIGN